MYIIYHNQTKRSFQYNQKIRQFEQISLHECQLPMRHMLCSDVIFHRTMGTTCSKIQRQPFNYVDRQMKQKKFMTMKRLQEKYSLILNRQNNDFSVKIPSLDTETSQRQILMSMN